MKIISNKIEVDYSTILLLFMSLLAGYIKYSFLICFIILFHELGHFLFFKLFHINIIKIIIYPFGGITYVNKKIHERIYKEFLCSSGGLLFQIILFIIFFFIYRHNYLSLSTYQIFIKYNTSIFFFNLLPLIPLDGSKLLNCLLLKFFSFKISYLLTGIISFISLIFFLTLSFLFKINNLILYFFLLWHLYLFQKNYKYIINKFYLERIMYNHYYNKIISNWHDPTKLRLDKFYFFKKGDKNINEKKYLSGLYQKLTNNIIKAKIFF